MVPAGPRRSRRRDRAPKPLMRCDPRPQGAVVVRAAPRPQQVGRARPRGSARRSPAGHRRLLLGWRSRDRWYVWDEPLAGGIEDCLRSLEILHSVVDVHRPFRVDVLDPTVWDVDVTDRHLLAIV